MVSRGVRSKSLKTGEIAATQLRAEGRRERRSERLTLYPGSHNIRTSL